MITLFNPATQTFRATNGLDGVSDAQMRINILIELRVMNALLLALTSGQVSDTLEQLRAAAVTDAAAVPPFTL